MDSPITGIWTELQRASKIPKGALTANCELELQELMRQIDKLIAERKKEWDRDKEGLQSRLGIREKEYQMQKSTLEQKHKEIGVLRVQLDTSENKQRDLVEQYETQVTKLRTEVQNMQREYERLQKRYSKYKKDCQHDKEKTLIEIMDGTHEVQKLNKKVEDYRQRSKEWDIDRRTLQKQIETLESQRKAISDKCEFVQQQAQTYQSQLDKRRELLDNTELSLNSQIAQLEAKLTTSTDSLNIQNSKVDKLKASLDDAMSSHKKAMDDNERLLNDLKKANNQNRKLEECNNELTMELRSRDDFLQMSHEDSSNNAQNIALLNQHIMEKDNIIKQLSDTKKITEDEAITMLKRNVFESEDQARLSKRNEDLLVQENSQLHEELCMKREDVATLDKKLQQKKADFGKLEDELMSVKSQLVQEQYKLTSLSNTHTAEIRQLKEQLTMVKSELRESSSSISCIAEKTTETERDLLLEKDEVKKRDSELTVANAQIEALRLENRHLRQTIIQQTQVNLDHTETETQLREIQDNYQGKVRTLENDNVRLKHEIEVLQSELDSLEDRYDAQLQRAVHEVEMSYADEIHREQRDRNNCADGRLQELEHDSDRRVSMLQDRLDSTINRYEEQLQLVRRQKARAEDDLDQQRRNGSFQPGEIVIEEEDEAVMFVNDEMSFLEDSIHSIHDLPTVVNEEGESAVQGESLREQFLQEEQERARDLESLIDDHIETLKANCRLSIVKSSKENKDLMATT